MKLDYDRHLNVAYIRLRDDGQSAETLRISDDLMIDVTADGRVIGIELLNAAEQLAASDDGNFVFIDPVSGDEKRLKVA